MSDPTMMPRNWHQAMRFLINELPYAPPDAEPWDWSPEFAEVVNAIADGRGVELQELVQLEADLARLREAVGKVEVAE